MSLVKILISTLFMVSIASGFLFMNCAKPPSQNQKSTSPSTGEKLSAIATGVPIPTSIRVISNSGGITDMGYSGQGFHIGLPSNAVVSFKVSECQTNASGYIGNCRLSGPIADPSLPWTTLSTDKKSTHRCTLDTSKICTDANASTVCTGAGNACRFFASGPVPFDISPGTDGCMLTYFEQTNDPLNTINFTDGTGKLQTLRIRSKIFSNIHKTYSNDNYGPVYSQCPICQIVNSTPTCRGGSMDGATGCEIHSTLNGQDTSLDCPPSPEPRALTLDLDMGPFSTGTHQIVLSSSGPNGVSPIGSGDRYVFAGVCDNPTEFPCSKNSDCTNHGGGSCEGLGAMANGCIDQNCPAGNNQTGSGGFTAERPGNYCSMETSSQSCEFDYTVSGVYKACSDAKPCNIGACLSHPTPCISGTGALGDQISVTGQPATSLSPLTGEYGDAVLASTFAVPPTGRAGIDTLLGLPGPGRVLQKVSIQAFPKRSICPLAPRAAGICAAGSTKGSIKLTQDSTDRSSNYMTVTIYPADTSAAAKASYDTTLIFGDLTLLNPNAAYFCAYDDRGLLIEKQIPSGVLCGEKPCLTPKKDSIKFKAPVPILGIKSVNANYKSIKIVGSGIDFNLMKPLPITGPLKVQFSSGLTNGKCWESTFTKPSGVSPTSFYSAP